MTEEDEVDVCSEREGDCLLIMELLIGEGV